MVAGAVGEVAAGAGAADEEAQLYSYYGIATVLDGEQPTDVPEADPPAPETAGNEPLTDSDAGVAPQAVEDQTPADREAVAEAPAPDQQ